MHEMAIALELVRQLEALADEHNAVRIESVQVTAGVLRQIVPDALETAFAAAAEGTRAAGAVLKLSVIPATARCRVCQHEFHPEPNTYLCAACHQADVEIVAGNEIVLASVTCEQGDGESDDED